MSAKKPTTQKRSLSYRNLFHIPMLLGAICLSALVTLVANIFIVEYLFSPDPVGATNNATIISKYEKHLLTSSIIFIASFANIVFFWIFLCLNFSFSRLGQPANITPKDKNFVDFQEFSYRFRVARSVILDQNYQHQFFILNIERLRHLRSSLDVDAVERVFNSIAHNFSSFFHEQNITFTACRLNYDTIIAHVCSPKVENYEVFYQGLMTQIGPNHEANTGSVVVQFRMGINEKISALANLDVLIKRSEIAAEVGRRDNRNISFYTNESAENLSHKMWIEQELEKSLSNNDFFLAYQPQLDLQTGKIRGYEGLIRWQHPTKGIISPAEFIDIAEESHHIVALGEWVLRTACKEASNWAKDMKVAVNISPLQLAQDNFLTIVDQILNETGLATSQLEMEITESLFVSFDDHISKTLEALRARGISIALDDFGTGYSSLGYLSSFPFDKIKLDRVFIKDLGRDTTSRVIIEMVVAFAKTINAVVIAEGIETKEQEHLVLQSGCRLGQGFLYGRPEKDILELEYISGFSDQQDNNHNSAKAI